MNYADIKIADVANGKELEYHYLLVDVIIIVKDVLIHQAWDFNYGKEFTEEDEEKVMEDLDHSYVAGLSLLGGEPLEHQNQKGLLPLLKKVKERFPEKNIWCYTGYKFDSDIVTNMFENWPETKELMSYIDVLVDGKFEEDKKDLNLKFRGSANQRIIDVQKSLKTHKVIPYQV